MYNSGSQNYLLHYCKMEIDQSCCASMLSEPLIYIMLIITVFLLFKQGKCFLKCIYLHCEILQDSWGVWTFFTSSKQSLVSMIIHHSEYWLHYCLLVRQWKQRLFWKLFFNFMTKKHFKPKQIFLNFPANNYWITDVFKSHDLWPQCILVY